MHEHLIKTQNRSWVVEIHIYISDHGTISNGMGWLFMVIMGTGWEWSSTIKVVFVTLYNKNEASQENGTDRWPLTGHGKV